MRFMAYSTDTGQSMETPGNRASTPLRSPRARPSRANVCTQCQRLKRKVTSNSQLTLSSLMLWFSETDLRSATDRRRAPPASVARSPISAICPQSCHHHHPGVRLALRALSPPLQHLRQFAPPAVMSPNQGPASKLSGHVVLKASPPRASGSSSTPAAPHPTTARPTLDTSRPPP